MNTGEPAMITGRELSDKVAAKLRAMADEMRMIERAYPALPREAQVSLAVSQDALDRAAIAIDEHKVSIDGNGSVR